MSIDIEGLDYKIKANIKDETLEFQKCKLFGYDCLMTDVRIGLDTLYNKVKKLTSRTSDFDDSKEVTLENWVIVNRGNEYVLNSEDKDAILKDEEEYIEYDEEVDLEWLEDTVEVKVLRPAISTINTI